MEEIILKDEAYAILGACFEVYKRKGCGFTETVYQECLKIEFEYRKIPYAREPILKLEYRGVVLQQSFRPDFICFDSVIVELKATRELIEANRSQTLNYLNATNFQLGLLVNFGHYPKLEYKRIANTKSRKLFREGSG
jgi:GxxExxY protein